MRRVGILVFSVLLSIYHAQAGETKLVKLIAYKYSEDKWRVLEAATGRVFPLAFYTAGQPPDPCVPDTFYALVEGAIAPVAAEFKTGLAISCNTGHKYKPVPAGPIDQGKYGFLAVMLSPVSAKDDPEKETDNPGPSATE